MSLEDLLEKNRRHQDAERFKALDGDECQICLAHGQDKRSLTIDCLYAIHEAVPEAIDLALVPEKKPQANAQADSLDDNDSWGDGKRRGYYLRICKSCRSRLLEHLKQWADEGRTNRGKPMDHDGCIESDFPDDEGEANIPIREFGAVRMITKAEWDKRHGPKEYKVVTVSSNTNSFGLYGMILIARDGECWEVAANSINVKPKGTVLTVQGDHWEAFGFEIPTRRTPNAPQDAIAQIWA